MRWQTVERRPKGARRKDREAGRREATIDARRPANARREAGCRGATVEARHRMSGDWPRVAGRREATIEAGHRTALR